MKLIIDIPEAPLYRDMYTAICENGYIFDEDNEDIAKAIKNGILIPDNATNGQIIQTLFKLNRAERTDDVLDKIRDEIERLHYHPKLDYIKNDEVVDMALDVIDKYR